MPKLADSIHGSHDPRVASYLNLSRCPEETERLWNPARRLCRRRLNPRLGGRHVGVVVLLDLRYRSEDGHYYVRYGDLRL